jgi:hypothetical protein
MVNTDFVCFYPWIKFCISSTNVQVTVSYKGAQVHVVSIFVTKNHRHPSKSINMRHKQRSGPPKNILKRKKKKNRGMDGLIEGWVAIHH